MWDDRSFSQASFSPVSWRFGWGAWLRAEVRKAAVRRWAWGAVRLSLGRPGERRALAVADGWRLRRAVARRYLIRG